MTLDCLLRPLASSFCVALTAAALMPQGGQAQAQQYGAPMRYGEPYAPPKTEPKLIERPSGVGRRRAMDDTPRREAYRAPPPRPSIWQGLYVGGNVGYVAGSATPSGSSWDKVDLSGAGLGLHAGYNAQFGNWVVGLEADGTWSNASGSRAFTNPATVDANANWTNSLRLRAGYAFDNVLVYATGGAALGKFDIGVTAPSVASVVSQTSFGYVVGAGVEMKFAQNWSGRLEALHYGFNNKTLDFATGSEPVDLGVTTVRAGISYHFH